MNEHDERCQLSDPCDLVYSDGEMFPVPHVLKGGNTNPIECMDCGETCRCHLIARARQAGRDEQREADAKIVEQYATDRLAKIVGPNGGTLPTVPSPREDIVAALRVAAKRVRGQG